MLWIILVLVCVILLGVDIFGYLRMSAMQTNLQQTLNDMASEQQAMLEELAKQYSDTIASVINNQSTINKNHKAAIENLSVVTDAHNKILRFSSDEIVTPSAPINITETATVA